EISTELVGAPPQMRTMALAAGVRANHLRIYLGETENLTVVACVWQFPLIAIGMAALLVCAISPKLPFRRVGIPGTAFIASIAYSAYLIQKLVIRAVEQFCSSHNIQATSALALVSVEICVYAAATLLLLLVERPVLQVRKRLTPRKKVAATLLLRN